MSNNKWIKLITKAQQEYKMKNMNTTMDKLIKLPLDKITLYKIALACWERGYYTSEDFVNFLFKNQIKIF